MSPPKKQKSLTSFFGGETKKPRRVVQRSADGSHFGTCPLCQRSIPHYQLERHASECNGTTPTAAQTKQHESLIINAVQPSLSLHIPHTSEPIPGLFLYEDFITEKEEQQILAELDGTDAEFASEFLPWRQANFNGKHNGKRWGVHCNLRDRRVGAAENPLLHFVQHMLIPRFERVRSMKSCVPNEANAIDYYRKRGDHLTSHVDDRKLSREPIANLSLAGDCYMTFRRNVSPIRNTAVSVHKVLLRRRCLQVLTGKARYDFSHGIENSDLLSDRRASVTMRESPLTKDDGERPENAALRSQQWWKSNDPSKQLSVGTGKGVPPVPGLFVFPNFITEEEEVIILKELDDQNSRPPWSSERHTGSHREKKWGIDHDLWSQSLRPPKYALPSFVHTIVLPRLKHLAAMQDYSPNDVNAIEYRRKLGHSLAAHVDDRKKHKEPIANLSLAGDCCMTYRNVSPNKNLALKEHRVLLQRRTLQVITGKARYEFSHGIANADLLSDRRVSVTMRETFFPG